jgi:hypothetical protein
MAEAVENHWSDFTVIQSSEIEEYLSNLLSFSEDKLKIEVYCIRSDGENFDYQAYLNFLREKLPYFVHPAEEVESSSTPWYDIMESIRPEEDFIRMGLWGELILFTMVDGLMDIPMVNHKISGRPERGGEVKGADGVYFGEYKGEERLGLGEAKFYSDDLRGAIGSALGSTMRFHGTAGDSARDAELMVARRSYSRDLSEQKGKELLEMLDSNRREYKHFHPVFIGYEEDKITSVQETPTDDDVIELVKNEIQEREIPRHFDEKLDEEDHRELRKFELAVFVLPVENSDEFKERMNNVLFLADKYEWE